MEVFGLRIDKMLRPGLTGYFELACIHVDGNRIRSSESRRSNGPQSNAAATEDSYGVPRSDAPASYCVKAHGEGLNEAEFTERQVGGIQVRARAGDVLSYRAIALHSEGLVVGTSIWTAAKTGRAYTAARVGGNSDRCPVWKVVTF